MQNPIFGTLSVLNRKEAKRFAERIGKQYGISIEEIGVVLKGYILLLRRKDNKIFIMGRDFVNIALDGLRINSIGLYFCKIEKGGIRLSIEGAGLIGPFSDSVAVIGDKDAISWLKGEDIPLSLGNGYALLKNRNDFLGCGFIKEGVILNHMPRERRLKEVV